MALWADSVPPELEPPTVVGLERDPHPWGRYEAWRFAETVRSYAHAASTFGIPLFAVGD